MPPSSTLNYRDQTQGTEFPQQAVGDGLSTITLREYSHWSHFCLTKPTQHTRAGPRQHLAGSGLEGPQGS